MVGRFLLQNILAVGDILWFFSAAVLWLESTLPSDPHSGMLRHKILPKPFLAGVPDSFSAEKSCLVMAKVRVRDLEHGMTVILNSAPAARLGRKGFAHRIISGYGSLFTFDLWVCL